MKINLFNLSSSQTIEDTKQALIKALGKTFESMKTDPLTAVVMCGSVIICSALYLRSCLSSKKDPQVLTMAKKDTKIAELEEQVKAKDNQIAKLEEQQTIDNAIYKLTTSGEFTAYIEICEHKCDKTANEMQKNKECKNFGKLVKQKLEQYINNNSVTDKLKASMIAAGCTKEQIDAIFCIARNK